MNLNQLLKRNTILNLFILFLGRSLAALPSVDNSVWEIFMQEYDWGSHIGKVKFRHGQLNSLSPQNEGQIIAIGSFKQKGIELFLNYTIVSVYAVHECQDISSKSKRGACVQAAEKYRPPSKHKCTYINSKTHPFYNGYFRCQDGSIIVSTKSSVALGSLRAYQGIPVRRYYYLSKIKGAACSVFTQIGKNPVRLEWGSNDVIPEGVEFAVLGKPVQNQENTNEYYLIFLHTEPVHHAPVWIRRECVFESR